jgi:predicted house-cleaning NTP pyrophosphatase (Maf/HAM1 superfamily)
MSVPSATVMAQAAKVAIEQDRPIYLDYYNDSLTKACCIGVQGTTKMLVKSDTEYTSPIESIMRIKEEKAYLVLTENSLYVVSADIPVKRIVGSGDAPTA